MKPLSSLVPLLMFISTVIHAQRPIVLDPSYDHTKWGISHDERDHLFLYAAFTSSFDGVDDNDDDGDPDTWGIPEWVAYEIKGPLPEHNLAGRPRWFTDDLLHDQGIAPNDDTYKVSGTTEIPVVKTDYRYVRGHMCPKNVAERISSDAAYNTHTIVNAVPQLQWQNNGIWKALEEQIEDWADEYGRVWVICGPVFFNKSPSVWLGQDGEVKAAVPDALFKIVIREDETSVKALAFLFPNILPNCKDYIWEYQTTVDILEALAGLDFLTVLTPAQQAVVESVEDNKSNW